MSGIFGLIWLGTLIYFVVLWRQKTSAKNSAGSNYEDDTTYQEISKKKRIVGFVCIAALVLSVITSEPDEASNSSTSTSISTVTQEENKTKYQEVNVDTLVEALEDNAAKAQKTYKNKKLKIVGGHVTDIDSDADYFSLEGSDDFAAVFMQCYTKNKKQKNQVEEFKKGQNVVVYGTVTDVGEVIGYSIDIDKIE